ncbi:MAG: AI-2E family transporter [Patescibacteria group bacterium]
MVPQVITISTKTILKVIVVVLLLWLLYIIRDILLLFFVAVILSSLIDPWATWCQSKRIPRAIAVIAIYIVLLGAVAGAVVLVVPTIVDESQNLVKSLGSYTDFDILANIQKVLLPSSDAVGKTIGGIVATVSSVFGGIFSLILVFVFTFYLVVEDDAVTRWIRSLTPDGYQPFIVQMVNKMKKKLGLWLRGQLLLSLFIGTMVYLGLLVLGVDYALVIGLIAALMEIVPYVGPVLSAVLAIFLAFTQTGDWVLPVTVAVMFWVIQVIENNLLVPRVMQRAVGINPIISILSILIGAKLAGIVGILIAIPLVTVLSVFIEEMRAVRSHEKIP